MLFAAMELFLLLDPEDDLRFDADAILSCISLSGLAKADSKARATLDLSMFTWRGRRKGKNLLNKSLVDLQ
jgi:hypothetical protein